MVDSRDAGQERGLGPESGEGESICFSMGDIELLEFLGARKEGRAADCALLLCVLREGTEKGGEGAGETWAKGAQRVERDSGGRSSRPPFGSLPSSPTRSQCCPPLALPLHSGVPALPTAGSTEPTPGQSSVPGHSSCGFPLFALHSAPPRHRAVSLHL